jgi:Zn-finger nucleic acid-binding protein
LRLIACGNCHAQYDVSGLIAEHVTCRCGDTLENRELSPVDAEIHRCGSCGAQVGATAESCGYCGSEIRREGDLSLICPECFARNADGSRFCTACGVAFRPEPLCIDGHELPCPACDASMPPSQVAGVGLNECPQCHGLWVPAENFDVIVQRATEACRAGQTDGAPAPSPRTTGGNPLRNEMKYRKCPECQAFMHRRNYRRSSGVIVDVCNGHGTWLDADELEEIAGFILSGGKTSEFLENEHQNARAEAAAAAAFATARVTAENRSLRLDRIDLGTDLAGGLVRLLTRILS